LATFAIGSGAGGVGLLVVAQSGHDRVRLLPCPLARIMRTSLVGQRTGYGDIVPLHPLALSLANVEAIIGQIYPATLLARFVTLELTHGS
jgi:hypothetical protein